MKKSGKSYFYILIYRFVNYLKDFENFNEKKAVLIGALSAAIWAGALFRHSDNRELNFGDLKSYIEKSEINNDTIVRKVREGIKSDVMKSSNIINKQEVIKMLDSTMVLFPNNSSSRVERFLKNKFLEKGTNASFLPTPIGPIILLSKSNNKRPSTIRHEFNHVVDEYAKTNNSIDFVNNLFNFKKSTRDISILLRRLTNDKHYFDNWDRPFNKQDIEYLEIPSEITVRIRNLKYFLYEHKFLQSPNSKIDKKVIDKLYSGEVFNSLSFDEQKELLNSDFFPILLFLRVEKFDQLNKYS